MSVRMSTHGKWRVYRYPEFVSVESESFEFFAFSNGDIRVIAMPERKIIFHAEPRVRCKCCGQLIEEDC